MIMKAILRFASGIFSFLLSGCGKFSIRSLFAILRVVSMALRLIVRIITLFCLALVLPLLILSGSSTLAGPALDYSTGGRCYLTFGKLVWCMLDVLVANLFNMSPDM